MNGLKNKPLRYKKTFAVLSVLYLIGLAFVLVVINKTPSVYNHLNRSLVEDIKEEITLCLENPGDESLKALLQNRVDMGEMDLVILAREQVLYQSRPSTNFNTLNQFSNEKNVSWLESYELGEGKYQIWLAVYPVSPVRLFTVLLGVIGLGVLGLCLISIVLYQLLFKRLISPIRGLKERVERLREFRLQKNKAGEIQSEYSVLSQELDEFVQDLDGKIKGLNTQYTKLEYKLESVTEQEKIKQQLVNSLVHSLKSPLNISLIALEHLKNTDERQDLQQLIEQLVQSNRQVLTNINEILTVMNNKEPREYFQKEHTDIVALVRESVSLFRPLLKERKLIFSLEAPKKLNMYINPILLKQIVNNMLSNGCKYTKLQGELTVQVYQRDKQVFLEAYNDVENTEAIEFDRVFDAFYHTDTDKNQYSSGVGLYTVKQLVEGCAGSCHFAPKGTGVQLSVSLPQKGEQE